MWFQNTVRLPPMRRGFHLITPHIVRAVPELDSVRIGWMHVFLRHTSASLTLNENADPDVRRDLETAINHIVPEKLNYSHTMEGADDMPAHVKASLLGPHVMVPINSGRLLLGTWQGIHLCEHREQGGAREIIVTLHGE